MIDLVKHTRKIIDLHKPEKLIVACSAGLDSTVLLNLCNDIGYPVEIAHVNYKLRGIDSDDDAKFLQSLAQKMKIPIHSKEIELTKELESGGNLQELARKVRYSHFHSLLKNAPNAFVLLAHHREDQTETFFMNTFRNAGIMGLSCMPELRGRFLRPLLNISKSDLRSYAEANNIIWREDVSNKTSKYTRNKWRNEILPELRETIPNLDESVLTLVSVFQSTQSELEEKIYPIHREIIKKSLLPTKDFHALDEFEQIELCRALKQPVGILNTWRKLDQKGTFLLLQNNKSCPFDRMVFDGKSYSFLSDDNLNLPKLKIQKVNSLPTDFTKWEIYLDETKIKGELTVRRVQTGDRIKPIGMKGSRLISDIVSDAKLTAIQKQELVIVTDEQSILWLPGHCISRVAIPNQSSSDILKIRLTDH